MLHVKLNLSPPPLWLAKDNVLLALPHIKKCDKRVTLPSAMNLLFINGQETRNLLTWDQINESTVQEMTAGVRINWKPDDLIKTLHHRELLIHVHRTTGRSPGDPGPLHFHFTWSVYFSTHEITYLSGQGHSFMVCASAAAPVTRELPELSSYQY